jgi:hypothetical protein
MVNIPTQWTNHGFMMRYEQIVKESDTYFEAYHKTEAEHEKLFGHKRYKNFESFRATRTQMIKR